MVHEFKKDVKDNFKKDVKDVTHNYYEELRCACG